MSRNLASSDLYNELELVTRGKVRDLYLIDMRTLLFVVTDRISAFDVVMDNTIPQKGVLLNLLSVFWFRYLEQQIPGLKTHFLSLDLPPQIPEAARPVYNRRCMQVRNLKVFPIEAIVRGYLAGSAWQEYQKSGTVHGIHVPADIQESQAFPNGPIYTPSTKAPEGEHDENIHPDRAVEILGEHYAHRIESLALSIYEVAHSYAMTKGIIIADTKFEFALDESSGDIVLVDEVLTPDSSRYWERDRYEVGQAQVHLDKQLLRDWLVAEGLRGIDGVAVPDHIARLTYLKYKEVYERLTEQRFFQEVNV